MYKNIKEIFAAAKRATYKKKSKTKTRKKINIARDIVLNFILSINDLTRIVLKIKFNFINFFY